MPDTLFDPPDTGQPSTPAPPVDLDKRPTIDQAHAVVTRLDNRRWTHPDPASTCELRDGATSGHPDYNAAVSCEHNSQQIAWKRAKAAALMAADADQQFDDQGRPVIDDD